MITDFWLEKNAKICIFKLIKAPKLTKRLKGSKSFHALDEYCHIMYVTEAKISTLSQIILETVGGVIMHGNFISKTVIYKRILGKCTSLYLTENKRSFQNNNNDFK